jgi:hypothetical protein
MANARVRIKGLEAMAKRIAVVKRRAVADAVSVLRTKWTEVLRLSQQYVPVELTDLHDSATLRVDIQKGRIVGNISYGNWKALIVHEDLQPHPVTHGMEYNIKHAAEIARDKGKPHIRGNFWSRRAPEQSKFLERAIRESTGSVIEGLKNGIRLSKA